ncbi:MFS transporter [Actinoplanes couchii]|uniref:MFS transporter n=1 Tax=Actinoplanes couchii TaxID=403638 RepID=A0ABQ3XL37_9ACTN|nr:MFS transporter [Actinoplanes couchii]MDR6318405.1 DHA2 family multidrug resistance protein-like MFS transporter [Actinoplanes couchii]GID59229.1 MFS transporter [Actinoplanes couchii]
MLALKPSQRWGLLGVISSGLLLITLDNSILYTALPTLTADLGATGTQALWIINAYPVVMAGLLLGSGTLGDRIGHRRMFLIGLGLFAVASLGAAFASGPATLIAARALLAVGAAAMMPATLALIRVTFHDERERNIAIAVWGSISVVGMSLGPIVGGALLSVFWWGSVFLINVPVAIAAAVATVLIALPNDPDPAKHWDLRSSVQVMAGLVGAVFAIKEVAHRPPDWTVVVVAVLISAAGFTLFARRQRRLPDPLVDFAIFRNPAFSAGVLAAALAMFAVGGLQLVTTQRYQLVEGFTPLQAGLLVATMAFGSLFTAMFGGMYLHRTGLLPLIGGGLAVAVLGVALIAAGGTGSFGLLITGLLVTGAGLGATMGVASSAIVGNAPARRAGMASSIEEVSYEFGSVAAVSLLGSLITVVYATTVGLPPGAPATAGETLPDALATAGGDPVILAAARAAYNTGFLVTTVVVAVVLAAGAALTARMLRHHGPGSPVGSREDGARAPE